MLITLQLKKKNHLQNSITVLEPCGRRPKSANLWVCVNEHSPTLGRELVHLLCGTNCQGWGWEEEQKEGDKSRKSQLILRNPMYQGLGKMLFPCQASCHSLRYSHLSVSAPCEPVLRRKAPRGQEPDPAVGLLLSHVCPVLTTSTHLITVWFNPQNLLRSSIKYT